MSDHSELKKAALRVVEIESSEGESISDAWEDFESGANPAAVLALISEVEGLRAQHCRDSAELRSLCQARDDARKERDQLKAEVEQLRKDAERFRFIEQDASSGMSKIYGDDWLEVVDQLIGMGDKS